MKNFKNLKKLKLKFFTREFDEFENISKFIRDKCTQPYQNTNKIINLETLKIIHCTKNISCNGFYDLYFLHVKILVSLITKHVKTVQKVGIINNVQRYLYKINNDSNILNYYYQDILSYIKTIYNKKIIFCTNIKKLQQIIENSGLNVTMKKFIL